MPALEASGRGCLSLPERVGVAALPLSLPSGFLHHTMVGFLHHTMVGFLHHTMVGFLHHTMVGFLHHTMVGFLRHTMVGVGPNGLTVALQQSRHERDGHGA
jgi:hypothetical protein